MMQREEIRWTRSCPPPPNQLSIGGDFCPSSSLRLLTEDQKAPSTKKRALNNLKKGVTSLDRGLWEKPSMPVKHGQSGHTVTLQQVCDVSEYLKKM